MDVWPSQVQQPGNIIQSAGDGQDRGIPGHGNQTNLRTSASQPFSLSIPRISSTLLCHDLPVNWSSSGKIGSSGLRKVRFENCYIKIGLHLAGWGDVGSAAQTWSTKLLSTPTNWQPAPSRRSAMAVQAEEVWVCIIIFHTLCKTVIIQPSS